MDKVIKILNGLTSLIKLISTDFQIIKDLKKGTEKPETDVDDSAVDAETK